jgi:hypothetical protein
MILQYRRTLISVTVDLLKQCNLEESGATSKRKMILDEKHVLIMILKENSFLI